MQWLRTSKYIFFILLKFQNLWKLINVLIHIYIYIYIYLFIEVFSMIFQSSMSLRKSRCDFPSGTTQRCFHPKKYIFYSFVVISFIAKKCCDVNDKKNEAS
jgi:hypothetical protein